MSFLSKLMDTMRLTEEDEDYFGPEDDYETERRAKRSLIPARDEDSYDERVFIAFT